MNGCSTFSDEIICGSWVQSTISAEARKRDGLSTKIPRTLLSNDLDSVTYIGDPEVFLKMLHQQNYCYLAILDRMGTDTR